MFFLFLIFLFDLIIAAISKLCEGKNVVSRSTTIGLSKKYLQEKVFCVKISFDRTDRMKNEIDMKARK